MLLVCFDEVYEFGAELAGSPVRVESEVDVFGYFAKCAFSVFIGAVGFDAAAVALHDGVFADSGLVAFAEFLDDFGAELTGCPVGVVSEAFGFGTFTE